ncbi:MAG TPA: ribonuclease domain-containing protein [Pseudoxanthomonas sp.]
MTRRSRSRRQSTARKPALVAIVLIVLLAGWFWQQRSHKLEDAGQPVPSVVSDNGRQSTPLPLPGLERETGAMARGDALPAWLTPEARETLRLIARGGPFPNPQDGSVFGNREGHLPGKPRGYYREYTVETPGLGHRGARRIVTGGQPPDVYYYSDDHYESFRSFTVTR